MKLQKEGLSICGFDSNNSDQQLCSMILENPILINLNGIVVEELML
jgi:hypothetical protein